MSFQTKVYVAQKADGEEVGVKLTFAAAHAVALMCAPAKVVMAIADKSLLRNVKTLQLIALAKKLGM